MAEADARLHPGSLPAMAGADPSSAFRLDGKVAVVTGASAGLGARFARVLDQAGATVFLAARRAHLLDELVRELEHAHPVACDIGRPDDRRRLVSAALEAEGHIDVLVNNAATSRVGPALQETDEAFAEVLGVNLLAPFALARDVAASMIETGRGGSIVNVASVLGVVGLGQIPLAGYAAAKGGLVNLTRELAAQWARRGVRVNALVPGWFRSEMTDEMFDDEQAHAWFRGRIPMGRIGEERELDGALLFLAGPASSYVTGQLLVVDGGWTAV